MSPKPGALGAVVGSLALAGGCVTWSLVQPALGPSGEAYVAQIAYSTVTMRVDGTPVVTRLGGTPANLDLLASRLEPSSLPTGAPSAPVTPPVSVTPSRLSGASLLLPVVVEADGLGGSAYRSDLTLASRAPRPVEVELDFYPQGQWGSAGKTRLTLAPGEQRFVPSVVSFLRLSGLAIPASGPGRVGALRVTFDGELDASRVHASVRTFTLDPAGGAGTFGLFYPAVDPTDGPQTLAGLRQDEGQRSNVAVVNGGPDPVTLRVSLFGAMGEPLGDLPDQPLGPYGWYQFGQPLLGRAAAGRAVVTRVWGLSTFAAYATQLDAVTSDGSYVPFDRRQSEGPLLVPVVVRQPGRFGSFFRTDLTLTSFTNAPLELTLRYRDHGGTERDGEARLTLAPLEQRTIEDVVTFLEGAVPWPPNGSPFVIGTLLVIPPALSPAGAFSAGARTYTGLPEDSRGANAAVPESAGTFGLFYPAFAASDCAEDVAYVYGLRGGGLERSNLGLVSFGDGGDDLRLGVQFYGPDGATSGPQAVVGPLRRGGWFQLDDIGFVPNGGYAKVERLLGTSRWVAYGTRLDNVTSDAGYIAMSR